MSEVAPVPSLPPIEDEQLLDLFARAEEIGLILEASDSGITWETWPGREHQDLTVAVYMSVKSPNSSGEACECYRAIDLAIRFPDRSVKRPDISIFCKVPPEKEGFVHSLPEAVVEIISPGYENKDLVLGPPVYLRNGVRDVFVLDRATRKVHHWSGKDFEVVDSPTIFALKCGCVVTV